MYFKGYTLFYHDILRQRYDVCWGVARDCYVAPKAELVEARDVRDD